MNIPFLSSLGARRTKHGLGRRATWLMVTLAVLFAVLAVAVPTPRSASAADPEITLGVTAVEYETATLSINVTDVDSSLNWKVNVVFKTDAYEHPQKNAGPEHTVSQGQESYSFDYDVQGSTVTANVYLNWLIPASDYTVEVKLCDTDCGSRNVKAEDSTTFSTKSGCTPHPTNRGKWFPGYHFTKVTENELTVRVHVNSSYAPLNSGRCVYYTYNTYFENDYSEIRTAYIRHIGTGGRTAQIELTGLEPGTRYGYHITLDVEAEDNAAGFSGSTLGPNTGISEIEFTDITNDSAKATATIKNASTDDKFVYWRYRESPLDGDPGIWLTLDKVSTKTATADKDLSYLEAGTRYEVEASVKDNFNLGMSMTRVFVTLPGKPGISPLEPGDGSLKVTWTAPDDGVATITGYTVKWQESEEYFTSEFPPPTTTLSTYDADADDTSYTITGLTNGTEYRVHVIAKNESGGTESNGEFGTPMGIPNAPNSLQVAPGNEKLTLTWEAPTAKVGVTVNGYKVQWKEDSIADWDAQTGVTEVSVNGLTREITSLMNRTTYDVRVRADNGITSDNYNWAEDDGTPRPDPIVTGVTVADASITRTSATATVAIDNRTDDGQTVHLQYRKTTESGWTPVPPKDVTATATSETFDLSPLTGNTDYVVEAWLATTSNTKASETFKTDPVEPDSPRNVEITGFGDGELTVAWDAPLGNGGSTITGYKVQWKEETTPNWNSPSEEADDASPYTIENLTNGTRYDVRVLAVNSVGNSPPSGDVEGTPSKKPDPPTDVEVSAHGNKWLAVIWTEPTDKGGLPTTYIVQWKWGNNDYNETNQADPATSPQEISNLKNGTLYTVRVLAKNDRGTSDDPGDGTNEDEGTPSTVPQPPTDVTITEFGDESLTVAWTAPTGIEGTGGSPVTGFKIQWKLNSDADWNTNTYTKIDDDDNQSPYTIEGVLTNGTKYDVRVIAVNINGDSRESGSATGTPSKKPNPPTGVDITDYGDGWLEVTWNAVTGTDTGGSDIKNYIVQWKSGTDDYDTTNQGTPTESPYKITSLKNGTEYTVRVLAVNETYPKDPSDDPGDGTNEDKETPRTKPKPPTGVNISKSMAMGISRLRWTAPEDNGGSALVSFKVQWKSGSDTFDDAATDGREKTVTAVAGTTTYETIISSLANGTRYTVRVLAVNGNRAIDNTSDTSNTASGTPSTMPRAPKSVTITNKGDRTLTVTWEPPDNDGGSAITKYKVQWKGDGETQWTTPANEKLASDRSHEITGLTNGVQYTVQVFARNEHGLSTEYGEVTGRPSKKPDRANGCGGQRPRGWMA